MGTLASPHFLQAATFLNVEIIEVGKAKGGPFLLAENEKKTADLVLEHTFDFFDEPDFIVAGVTENAYSAGHGSDTVKRSAEALTRATASLQGARETAWDSNQANQHHSAAVRRNSGPPYRSSSGISAGRRVRCE